MIVSMSEILQLIHFYDVDNYNAIIPRGKKLTSLILPVVGES